MSTSIASGEMPWTSLLQLAAEEREVVLQQRHADRRAARGAAQAGS